MTSDVIESEIDRTTDEINQKLLILSDRVRRAKDDARRWFGFAMAAGAICAALAAGVAALVAIRGRQHRRKRFRAELHDVQRYRRRVGRGGAVSGTIAESKFRGGER